MGRAYFPPTTTGSDDEPHFPSAIPQAPQVGGVSRIEMKTSSRAAWPHGVSRSEMKILNRDKYCRADGVSRSIQNTLVEHTKHTCCCRYPHPRCCRLSSISPIASDDLRPSLQINT